MTFSIKCLEGPYGVNFHIESDHLLAVAEISQIDKESFFSYCEIGLNQKKLIDLKHKLQDCDDYYFFNRLNVPKKLRGQSLGKELLYSVLNYCKTKNIALLNTANEYGDWTQDKLIDFYEKSGMTLIHPDGLLIYHNFLEKKIQLRP